jgi:uncharacterized phiE125 gp8 family phage protein
MLLQLKTPPTAFPVGFDELKYHMRLDSDFELRTIRSYLLAAVMYVENLCGPLITQTWNQFEQHFPSEWHWRRAMFTESDTVYMGGSRRRHRHHDFELGEPTVQSIAQITYTLSGGTVVTLPSTVYALQSNGQWHNKIVLQRGQEWPEVPLSRGNPICLQYVCGYGDTGASVPAPITQAILLLVSMWYENREPVLTGPGSQMVQLPFAVDALLANYRWEGF